MGLQVNKLKVAALLFALLGPAASLFAQETRIKDLVNVRGMRNNQLIGFGLVIGLQGTGDSAASIATNQAASQMMTRLGLQVDANAAASSSIAAVVVTVDLPTFARIGDRVDVKISAIGNANSLAGGTLVMTPLKAGDQRVYVIAAGSVVTGQATGQGNQVLTVARVPNGGVVEREFIPDIASEGYIYLSLRQPDFVTSSRISERINEHFKGFFAKSTDATGITVEVPVQFADRIVDMMAELEVLRVAVDRKARVVMNERTGTVVMGADVTIGSVAIAHGELSIRINQDGGQAEEGEAAVANMPAATVGELIELMNALGMKPNDLIGVLQAIHAAGALQGELQFI